MKKILLFACGMIALALVACSNNKDDDNSVNAATRYTYLNGSCYDNTTGGYVQPTYCQNQYVMTNGICYSTANGQYVQVQPVLCQQQGTNGYYMSNGVCYSPQGIASLPQMCTAGAGGAAQCYGNYIYNTAGQMQPVQCAGANCRGFTLIEQATGRQVLCQ